MESERLREMIERIDVEGPPRIELIKRAKPSGPRVGIFASSFNPITSAHVELMRRAIEACSLDEMIALAGLANADKTSYECALEDRLKMLALTFAHDARTSIGLSSHAFYVDMIDALRRDYPQSDLHFVVGFDTFERVLDPEDRYTKRYHRRFNDRLEALDYLLSRSRIVVAARRGAGRDAVQALLANEPERFRERISYLDFPSDLGERSATEVRLSLRAGQQVTRLVPEAVEQYIQERGLYK
ncbi:MAG TPA: nicotinate-nicotinamide nucleotide adenylyltransferase [Blastocatellia bacterium]|nr:nicotinate-nicotinamide nucleotide adenylyltransferase [Blastocatellia bacterium]